MPHDPARASVTKSCQQRCHGLDEQDEWSLTTTITRPARGASLQIRSRPLHFAYKVRQ